MYTRDKNQARTMYIKAGQYNETEIDEKLTTCSVLFKLESRNGYVFSVISAGKDYKNDLSPICLLLKDESERLSRSFGQKANPQHRFEQFLGSINERLSEQIRGGAANIPIEEFGAFVGVVCDQEMYLSGTGQVSAMFLKKGPKEKYKVFNLTRGIETEQEKPNWEKAFTVILDGEMENGDIFCISSHPLQPLIRNEDLNNILSTLPPTGAAAKIRQYFPIKTSLSLIILKGEVVEKGFLILKKAVPLSGLSLSAFGDMRDKTKKILEDQKIAFKWKGGVLKSIDILIIKIQKLKKNKDPGKKSLIKFPSKLAHLDIRTKFIIVSALILLVLFVASLQLLALSKMSTEQKINFQGEIAKIEDLREQAAAAAIYKDEDRARQLYLEAILLIENLPTDNDNQKKEKNDLLSQVNTGLLELRNIITIPEPPVVADLSIVEQGLIGLHIFKLDDYLIIVGNDKNVYRLDREQKIVTKDEDLANEIGNSLFYIDDRPGIMNTELTSEGNNWSDVSSYLRRIYVLSPSEEQIIRYSIRGGGNFGSPINWIRSKSTDLKDAIGLTIDGNVYVLKASGQVVRFINGAQEEWEVEKVDPAVTAANKIWTNIDSDYVYVLEPVGQRLIIFRKESGEFLLQYHSDKFTDLRDFLVDEEAKTVYLLNGQTVFAIASGHLE